MTYDPIFLSVIIPVYNTLCYLPTCLQSIEKQNFKNMEIILVDDGSTDGSSEYCDQYKATHENVLVIHKQNGGAGDSRNVGLLAAKGLYIHFIDSDDVLDGINVYNYFYNILASNKLQIVFFRFSEYIQDYTLLDSIQPEFKTKGFFQGDVLKEVLIHRYVASLTSPVNKIFFRSFLIDNELFFVKELDHEEDEWLPRVLSYANQVYFDNHVFYAVRKGRKGSLSETLDENSLARKACSKIRIARTGMKYMQDRQLNPETKTLIAEYYWNYLTDACVSCNQIKQKELKQKIYKELQNSKDFFNSYTYLTSKNRRLLGRLFRVIGVKITVSLVGIRYGK